MNSKRYTTEKWFEKELGLKGKLQKIYLLVDCYFLSRGRAAISDKYGYDLVKMAVRDGLLYLSESQRLKITPAGKQHLRDHKLTKVEHADLRREHPWLEGAA